MWGMKASTAMQANVHVPNLRMNEVAVNEGGSLGITVNSKHGGAAEGRPNGAWWVLVNGW